MLDSRRGGPELLIQAITPPFVAAWPGEIVRDHLQVNVLPLAAIGPGEPWPDDRHHRLGELSALGQWKLVPSKPALPRDEFIQVDDRYPPPLRLPQAPPGRLRLSRGLHPRRCQSCIRRLGEGARHTV
jgi:hypothetical protein